MKLAFVAAANSPHTIKWVNALLAKGHEVTLYSMPNHREEHGEIVEGVQVEYLGLNEAQNGVKKNVPQLKGYLAAGFGAVVAIDISSYGYMAAKAGANGLLLVSTGIDVASAVKGGNKSLVAKVIKQADGVLASAPNIITSIQALYKKEQRYYVVPFGIDMELFQKRDVQKGEVPCFGSLKFLEFGNGVDMVLEAFAKYLETTGKDALLKVVGSGGLAPDLKNQAQNLGIAGKVEFLGYVKNSEMPDVINTMDVVVQMPPEESFGVSGIEAMACEVPLVASDTVGVSEYVLDHVTGYVVKAGNTDACARKMFEAVRNPDARAHMGSLARGDVQASYNLNDCIAKFETALNEISGRVR